MVEPQGASLAFAPAAPALPAPPPPSGSSAAAILLMLIGEDEAAEVLSRLEPAEVEQLGGAMMGIADVSEGQVDGVLDEFVVRARRRTTLGYGAEGQVRGMMERALGPERAGTILGRITPEQRGPSLEALKWMEPRAIAALIEHEHPQLIAMVLAHLDPGAAADVLQLMDEGLQPMLIQRVATLGPVTREALEDIERLLLRPAASPAAQAPASRRGGAGDAAQIVNSSRKSAEQRILRALQKLDRNLARSIEDEMFVFDNLLALDDKSLGTLMRQIDGDVLPVALKGASKPLAAKIFACMSSRAAQSIQDAIADRGPVRLAEVQEAQKEVLAIARRLAAEGTINLGGKDDDYV